MSLALTQPCSDGEITPSFCIRCIFQTAITFRKDKGLFARGPLEFFEEGKMRIIYVVLICCFALFLDSAEAGGLLRIDYSLTYAL